MMFAHHITLLLIREVFALQNLRRLALTWVNLWLFLVGVAWCLWCLPLPLTCLGKKLQCMM